MRWMLSLVVYTMIALCLFWSLYEAWRLAPIAGAYLRDTGQLSSDGWFFDAMAAPARIVPKGSDPQNVCTGMRSAVLIGRSSGTAFVVLVPLGANDRGEVVSLPDSDYAVITGLEKPSPCSLPIVSPHP